MLDSDLLPRHYQSPDPEWDIVDAIVKGGWIGKAFIPKYRTMSAMHTELERLILKAQEEIKNESH